jgi:hypothetical protein
LTIESWWKEEAYMRLFLLAGICVAVIGLSPSAHARLNMPHTPQYGEAPIGHRQPTPETVQGAPKGVPNDTLSKLDKENQELDRKLRSICRGC